MKEFTYTIKEPVGIHARPAGMLAKEAKTCQSTVTIVDKNGKSVDATRLMALMGMGIKCRSFYVGEGVTQEDIHAKYEHGVLKLSIPKKEEQKKVEKSNYIAIE